MVRIISDALSGLLEMVILMSIMFVVFGLPILLPMIPLLLCKYHPACILLYIPIALIVGYIYKKFY